MIPKMTPKMTQLVSPVSQNVLIKCCPEISMSSLFDSKLIVTKVVFRENKHKGGDPFINPRWGLYAYACVYLYLSLSLYIYIYIYIHIHICISINTYTSDRRRSPRAPTKEEPSLIAITQPTLSFLCLFVILLCFLRASYFLMLSYGYVYLLFLCCFSSRAVRLGQCVSQIRSKLSRSEKKTVVSLTHLSVGSNATNTLHI